MNYFIKSYGPDVPWLRYCLRSVAKFDADHKVIVVVEKDVSKETAADLEDLGRVEVIWMEQAFRDAQIREGYVRQQYIKLCADRCFPDGDHVQLDSDMVMLRKPEDDDFYYESKPMWFYRSWEDAGEAVCWREATALVVGHIPPYEFMCRPGFLLNGQDLPRIRRALKKHVGKDLAGYMNTVGRHFSEYNAMGAVLYDNEYQSGRAWLHAKNQRRFPDHLWSGTPLLEQAWSYGGLKEDRIARYEEMLR